MSLLRPKSSPFVIAQTPEGGWCVGRRDTDTVLWLGDNQADAEEVLIEAINKNIQAGIPILTTTGGVADLRLSHVLR